jgi:CDP-diglyceride synthetase
VCSKVKDERIALGLMVLALSSIVLIYNPIGLGLLIVSVCLLEIINACKKYGGRDRYLLVITSILYLAVGFGAYYEICSTKRSYFVYAALLSATGDTLGYVIGRWAASLNRTYSGKNQFIKKCISILSHRPTKLSPNKTVAGFLGVAVAGLAVNITWNTLIIALSWSGITLIPAPISLPASICFSMLGQAGDLLESSLKRRLGIKDIGSLLGPHGGFCDRFDSLISIVIGIYIYLRSKGILT